PETVTFASPGVGTDDHLEMVLIQEATGARFTHVVFQGDPQLRTAILARQVDAMGLNVGPVTAAPDNMRMLAQAGAERSRFRPDVPTLRELGIPVDMASERGVVAPAATPPAIIGKLREAAADIARDPEFIRVMESRFTYPSFEEGGAWFQRLAATRSRYVELWQKTPWSQR
ncbi:MAG TPA: tripartite tricarboxylate transporter substrate-binding protein, partial [Roseomonas sp.]